jgi:hypothetical protein
MGKVNGGLLFEVIYFEKFKLRITPASDSQLHRVGLPPDGLDRPILRVVSNLIHFVENFEVTDIYQITAFANSSVESEIRRRSNSLDVVLVIIDGPEKRDIDSLFDIILVKDVTISVAIDIMMPLLFVEILHVSNLDPKVTESAIQRIVPIIGTVNS